MAAPTPPEDGSPYFPVTERAASIAVTHIAVTSPLLGLGLLMYGLRIWIRTRPSWRVSLEDYFITAGVATTIVVFGFLLPQMHTTPTLLTEEERIHGAKYSFLAIPIWGIAMSFIKASIALTLLKIQPQNLWWKVFCFSVLGIQCLYGVANTFFILLQCRPPEASWNPAILAQVDGECLDPIGIHIMSNIGSAINIGTDVLLSLAPTLFLWKLKRPLREKMLVGLLMALGLFASTASIVKTTLVTEFGTAEDSWALVNAIATWTALEQLLAMIAASAPFLKPLLQSALHKFGFSLSDTRQTKTGYGGGYGNKYQRATRQSTFHGAEDHDGRLKSGTVIRTTNATTSSRTLTDHDSPFTGSDDGIPLETVYVRPGQATGADPHDQREGPSRDSGDNTSSDKTIWSQRQFSPADAV